ncbi:MAG: HEPN domain protein [Methanoregulaceae archaeon PtaU1.Bin059]|nr:MAG: HEPN domain protein [Methanoregulaceae archaeon PtaB.Bin152]OPY40097.1 MAG: HEPN domain protein [Methanoregulaceae archaeon PtaU1.Bin059]
MFTLEECFERGLLRKTQPSAQKATRSLDQARVWLEEARITYRAEAYRSALVAAYMAYFHAARAILFRDGLREKSHGCILLYLESYAQKGLIDHTWVERFDQVMSIRNEDQYTLGAEPFPGEIKSILEYAPEFIQIIEQILGPQ